MATERLLLLMNLLSLLLLKLSVPMARRCLFLMKVIFGVLPVLGPPVFSGPAVTPFPKARKGGCWLEEGEERVLSCRYLGEGR